MMKNIVEIVGGEFRQPQYHNIPPLNITIGEGEQIALVGGNGSGKSIVVGAITGAHPLKGLGAKYSFGEGRTSRISDNIKYLAFRDSYGVADRGYYHQQRWNSFDREGQPLVKDMLPLCEENPIKMLLFDLFDMESMLNKEMILLSSGELRKFQFTKALLSAPKILILEDPFIGLDAKTRLQLDGLLSELTRRCDLQVVLVLSKSEDIPEVITHIVAVESGACQPKVTTKSYLETLAPTPPKVISSEVERAILDLAATPSHNPSDSVVEFNNVSIRYDEHTILKDITWSMKRGEQWALSGENGAGKSTLLSLICADNPQGYACDITLFGRRRGSGESIWDIKRNIGYVSPEMHRSYCESAPCIEIVASGLHDTVGLYKRMKPEDSEVCQFWMGVFGISHLCDRDFMRVSSGEQRLVLLARAFVKDPELMILDEPLHGLDNRNRRLALDVIETYMQRPNKSLILVTHYREELPKSITNSLHLVAPQRER